MIYSVAIRLYALAAVAVSPFCRKARMMVKGQRETFRVLRKDIRPGDAYVWFHAASLGEFEQGRPLMERLRREHPRYRILLTFFSPSGYEVRKDYEGADVVCYLPFDTPGNVRRFLRLARPCMAFFIKYEFWSNYLHACRRQRIPVYVVSAIFRGNQVFFRWYGRGYGDVLRCVTCFFVQDEASRELLARKGITNVIVSGDTRFDRVLDICRQAKELPLVKAFRQDAKVLVAGSTWKPDEDLIIPWFNAHPEMKLVLTPHVVDGNRLKEIEGRLHRPFARYSRITEESAAQADCLIIDGYGLLSSVYRYGEAAYVGGGFGAGIHNVTEAAVYGVPVLVGPNNRKFREAQDLLREGGCIEVANAAAFDRAMVRLLSDGKTRNTLGRIAGQYITRNAGATNLIFDSVKF